MQPRLPQRLGQILTLIGGIGLFGVSGAYLHAVAGSHQALEAFDAAAADQAASASTTEELEISEPDQTLWSETRKRKFAELDQDSLPLGILEIDRLNLRVPIYPGTDRITLNRGAGIVEGTAYPGESGNMVLSAHRDGFFRSLKDIEIGDRIRVRTLRGENEFVVSELFITDPLDLSVLSPSETPTVTLITCYPFYYVGFAPDRLIVRTLPARHEIAQPDPTISMQKLAASSASAREGNVGSPLQRQPENPANQ